MTDADASPPLMLERLEDGIAIVRISRPKAMNALSPATVAALHSTLDKIHFDDSIRVVVLTGTDKAFCAGLDLKSLDMSSGGAQSSVAGWTKLQDDYSALALRLRALPQPIVAAIRGPAIGVGLALALASDVRVAGHSADLRIGAVKIGLSAGESGISYHLPRLIGAARAFEIMLTGRSVDAREALAIGLVSQLVEDEAVMEKALDVARDIASNSPYSIRQSKRIMWINLEAPSLEAAVELENRVQVIGLLTEDFREAIDAFAGKRLPRFRGA